MKSFTGKKLIITIIAYLALTNSTFAQDKSLIIKDAKAYGLYSKEKYDSAILNYRKAIEISPKFPPLYDGIGDVYLKKNQFDRAYNNFKVANRLDPKNSLYKVHSQEAVYLSIMNRINNAKTLFGGIKKTPNLLPDHPKINKNIENIRDGRYTGLEFITDLYLNYKDKNLTRGNIALNQQNYKAAETLYYKAINQMPRNYQAYNNLGLVYLVQGKIPNAISCFKKSIQLNSKAIYPYNNLGVAYSKIKRYNDAVQLFNESYFSSRNNKAVAIINDALKNIQTSISYLESLVRSEPDNISAKQLLGQFYALSGNWEKAVNIYKSGLQNAADNHRYIRRLGDLFFLENKFPEAIACYKKSISLNAEEPASFIAIARAYEKNNDSKNAFSNYQTAVRLNPNYSYTYRYFGTFLIHQKRDDEAKGILKKYIDLAPDNFDTPMVKNTLRKLYSEADSY